MNLDVSDRCAVASGCCGYRLLVPPQKVPNVRDGSHPEMTAGSAHVQDANPRKSGDAHHHSSLDDDMNANSFKGGPDHLIYEYRTQVMITAATRPEYIG